MNDMDIQKLEESIQADLHRYLISCGELEERLPETQDIDDCWPKIGEAYLPDGIREFAKYPAASLGWMMYVGMAVAKFWDDDWALYCRVDNLYSHLLGKSGYDLLDEQIRGPILGLRQPEYDSTEALVSECAQRTHTMLLHARFEPGTEAAFRGYVACLHQLYRMGAAVQLHRMGYRMRKM